MRFWIAAYLFFSVQSFEKFALAQTDSYEDFFGVNVFSEQPVYLNDVVDMGAKWVRIEYRLKGKDTLNHYRNIIDKLKQKKVKVLLLVDYMSTTAATPGWKGTDALWTAYLPHFLREVESIAQFLKNDVDAWEVWNEPDHELEGYDPGVPAHIFGVMLKDAATRIRKHSSSPLVIGGLATKRFTYYENALKAAGGDLTMYDALGLHTYGASYMTKNTVKRELDYIYKKWFELSGLPIWLTEAGGVGDPQNEKFAADYVETLFTHTWDHHRDYVKRIFYFSWHDIVGFRHERFGLVRLNNSRKPSFLKFRELVDNPR